MRNDNESYESYNRKFKFMVFCVIVLILVLWFGNFDSTNGRWDTRTQSESKSTTNIFEKLPELETMLYDY